MQDYNKFKVAEREALQRENQGPSMQLSPIVLTPFLRLSPTTIQVLRIETGEDLRMKHA